MGNTTVAKDSQKLEAFIYRSIKVGFCSVYHASYEKVSFGR